MNNSSKIDIQDLSDKLIELAQNSCWNDFSKSYAYIFSEIVNDDKDFVVKRIWRKKSNAKKRLLSLDQAREEIDKLYYNLYDVNFYVYKATKSRTIIEVQYYSKSSLDKEYYEKVKDNVPMLHCKVPAPFYLKNENDKFDVNWELLGLRYKWNAFLHRFRIRNRI